MLEQQDRTKTEIWFIRDTFNSKWSLHERWFIKKNHLRREGRAGWQNGVGEWACPWQRAPAPPLPWAHQASARPLFFLANKLPCMSDLASKGVRVSSKVDCSNKSTWPDLHVGSDEEMRFISTSIANPSRYDPPDKKTPKEKTKTPT